MRSALLAFAVLAGCAAGPAVPADGVDPARYGAQDPEGQAAYERALQALDAGQRQQALPELRTAIARCPDFVRAHLAYQDAALALGGDAEQEMRAFYRGLEPGPSPVPAYVKARLLDTSFARAGEVRRILAADGRFAWAHLSLGRIERDQGRLLVAVDAFRSAAALDPTLHEARLDRADALAELGRLEEAAVDYEAYLAAVPEDWVVMREYAAMLIYRLPRIDRALGLLDRLDEEFPGDLDLGMHRGAAYWRAGQPRVAVTHYLAVLEKDPGYARAALNLGLIYYDAIPRTDAEREVWWPRARAAFRYFLGLGNPRDGQEVFERALAVPYRLEIIAERIGADDAHAVTLDELRPPPG